MEVYLLPTEIEAVNRMFIDTYTTYLHGDRKEPHTWHAESIPTKINH